MEYIYRKLSDRKFSLKVEINVFYSDILIDKRKETFIFKDGGITKIERFRIKISKYYGIKKKLINFNPPRILAIKEIQEDVTIIEKVNLMKDVRPFLRKKKIKKLFNNDNK